MMEAETLSETLHYNTILTLLIALEGFISFNHHESFTFHII
jgi:hypothetical protein